MPCCCGCCDGSAAIALRSGQAAVRLVHTRRRVALIVSIIVIGAALNGLLAILQAVAVTRTGAVAFTASIYDAGIFRPSRQQLYLQGAYQQGIGLFQSATNLGAFLASTLPLLTAWRLLLPGLRRLIVPVALLITIGMLATATRHAVLALLLAALSYSLLLGCMVWLRWLLPMLACGIALMLATNLGGGTMVQRWLLRPDPGSSALLDESSQARIAGLERYADFWVVHPLRALLGRGPGADDLVDRGLVPLDEAAVLVDGFVSVGYPLMAYDIGLVGGLAYCALIGQVLADLCRRILYQNAEHRTPSAERCSRLKQQTQLFGLPAISGELDLSRQQPGVEPAEQLAVAVCSSLLVAVIAHWFDNHYASALLMKGHFWLLLAVGARLGTGTSALSAQGSEVGDQAF